MLRISEGRRQTLNIATGETTDLGPVFIVTKPLIFAGQDIGEHVAEFNTREEAEAYVAQVEHIEAREP